MSKKKRYSDPHAAREAARYENPVPSREAIIQLLSDQGKPLTEEQILTLLDIQDEDGEVGIHRRLRAMLRDGQLVQNRRGRLGLAQRMDLIAGRVQGHKDGFGFVIPDEKGREDLFLPPRQMRAVLDGDRVMVSAEGRNRFGKEQGRVVEVLERATDELVGQYHVEAGVRFLEPQNRRITQNVLITDLNGVDPQPGDHIRAQILRYPDRDTAVQVKLLEIIAGQDEPGMEVDVALRRYEIPHEWPPEVDREAEKVPESVPEKAKQGRYDLRELPLITVDGEDAKDFDDAVYIERRKRGGWRLIVAIADVSHYVRPDSALDREAEKRGNSVYFPNRVIPMLPEVLSNGLCSLNPDVDRLCLFCDMQVSAAGQVSGFTFREGVMRSRHRLTYTKVGAFIEEPESDLAAEVRKELDPKVQDMLWTWFEMFNALRKRRQERGAADFDTVETRIIYDEHKKIEDIVPVQRNVAHIMIEEAMLAANISAAKLLEKSGLPALFRNHEPPPSEKLESLQAFLGGLGLSLAWSSRKGEATPDVFQQLTEEIQDRPDKQLIQTVMLRSFSQAKYEAENKGHFGLAYQAYTHFTSPIRRYPDLLVHRAIRYLIRNAGGGLFRSSRYGVENTGKLPKVPKPAIIPYSEEDMARLGEHCSMTERRADDATRDVEKWLKCQYMEQHLGAEMQGVISGVAGFGLFITLSDLYIEGMIHVSSLESDYYHFDEVRHALVGESSGRMYQLGDEVRVQVAGVNVEDRKIDLLMVDGPAPGRRRRRRGGSQKKPAGKKAAARKGSEREKVAKGEFDGKKAPAKKKAARKGPPRGKKARRRR